MKRPSFQFYPADWRKDAALQSCSMAAQGLWINLMCIAHECEPYGHLIVNGRAMTPAQIARLVGLSAKECGNLLQEIIDTGVIETNSEGVMYSRRMVRDEQVRNARAEGGKAGSSHGWKGAEYGAKGGRPRKETGDKKPPLYPPPSSSSSSSPSVSEPIGSEEKPAKRAVITKPEGITDEVWQGFLAIRKAKKAPLSAAALEGIQREATKAGINLQEALLMCCTRGWQGFKAEWVTGNTVAGVAAPVKAGRHSGFEKIDYREGINADGTFA